MESGAPHSKRRGLAGLDATPVPAVSVWSES
jgi:hypothetical protein